MQTILCIDDNPDALKTLFYLLSAANYNCVGASTPIEARRRYIADCPDLVIVDHGLPGEDGTALAANLKQLREVPVLMLTGRAELNKPDSVDVLLIKPQEPQAILKTIAKLLKCKSHSASAR